MLVPVPLLVFSVVLMRHGNDMVLTGPEPALGPDREAGDPLSAMRGAGIDLRRCTSSASARRSIAVRVHNVRCLQRLNPVLFGPGAPGSRDGGSSNGEGPNFADSGPAVPASRRSTEQPERLGKQPEQIVAG